ncbi:M15 family metallopeptidase [Mesorhizobium sp. M0768]|uniref:M15 family metallopeptidase n=1 Tax=Mesorhizobium sp. M0768 TaxID=2956996 RepID=UPI00333ABD79
MTPVIKDAVFNGRDNGLTLPVRRLVDGPYELTIGNLDRADPPSPYSAGGVPRSNAFNGNVFTLSTKGGMPEIKLSCKIGGFDPAKTPIIWRLQSFHVLGRYQKKGGTKENPNYYAKVVRLGDEWQGASNSAAFSIFPAAAPADHVGGGHALLSVAARPPGATNWLQDVVHVRIIGANPDEAAVRAHIRRALNKRDANLWHMLDAIFAWEAGFRHFNPSSSTKTKYKGVPFEWPTDPAQYPIAAFDFGVGLSQFTHPDDLTASIAWDWRDNMNAGINIFLDALGRSYKSGISWRVWALKGWKAYNGAASYADDRAASADGKLVSAGTVPAGFDVKGLVARIPLVKAPVAPPWPVITALVPEAAASVARADQATRDGVAAIVDAVTARVTNRETLVWLWPQLEKQMMAFDGHLKTTLFPGLDAPAVVALLETFEPAELAAALRLALMTALERITLPVEEAAGAITATISATASSADILSEWNQLSAFVRSNISDGFAGFQNIRGRLYTQFGAPGNPAKAIERVNAYYKQMVGAGLPKASFKSPVHPDLKIRLAKAATLLAAKGAQPALNTIKSVGGFNIRPNVNSPGQLSNHSFGWAVDIDPEINPNIKKTNLPLAIIAAFTGVDLYGAESVQLRTPAPYDTLLPAATILSRANAAFVAAFATAAGLKDGMGTAVTRLCGATLPGSKLTTAYALATAVPAKLAELGTLLEGAGATPAKAKAAARVLADSADLFRKAAKVSAPKIIGIEASVARFGFFNLAPEAAAGLAASDGGGLRWLGAAVATKDYMHFELFGADQPKLF